MFSKKTVWAILLSLALVTVVAACGDAEDGDVSDDASPGEGDQEQVELTVWLSGDPGENEVNYAQIEAFEEAHPHINLDVDLIPSDDYRTMLNTQAAGGEIADVFRIWPAANLEPIVNGEALRPLDDIVDHWEGLLNEDALAEYNINDTQWGIPGNMSFTHFVFYDVDMLAQAGYDEFPADYEEFKQLITDLRAEDITPIALGNGGGGWVLQSVYLSTIANRITGDDFLEDVLAGERQFTDPEFIEALTVIEEMVELDAFNPDYNTINNDQAMDYFAQGNAAMTFEGSWATKRLVPNLPEDKNVEVTTLSFEGQPTDSISGTAGGGLGINSELEGAQEEAAIEFIKFFFDEHYYEEMAKMGDISAANIEIPEEVLPLNQEVMELAQDHPMGLVYDAVLHPGVINTLNNGLQSLAMGQTTPEELAETMQREIE